MSNKKEIRKKFKESVFKRDNYTCVWCGEGPFGHLSEEYLDAHHITDRSEMPNGGYVKENGIALCKKAKGISFIDGEDGLPDIEIDDESCHMKAEKFHISDGLEWNENMHPDDLYKRIGSSKELAIEKSNGL